MVERAVFSGTRAAIHQIHPLPSTQQTYLALGEFLHLTLGHFLFAALASIGRTSIH
jgi:hypothetical protein